MGGLVDRELDPAGAVLDHLGHEGGVFGADVLVVEADELRKAQNMLVEADPLVHLALLHVGDDVVDGRQAAGLNVRRVIALRIDRAIAWSEDAPIAIAIDEAVRRVAVGLDARAFVDAELVLQDRRRLYSLRAPFGRRLVRGRHVFHVEGDVLHAVSVH